MALPEKHELRPDLVGLERSCRRDAEMAVVLRQGLRGPPPTEARKRESHPLRILVLRFSASG